jgi:hypothetical protein
MAGGYYSSKLLHVIPPGHEKCSSSSEKLFNIVCSSFLPVYARATHNVVARNYIIFFIAITAPNE